MTGSPCATAHPRWIVDAYADRLPADELEAALRADNVDPPVTLAVRPGLAEVDELLAAGAEPGRHVAVRRPLVRATRPTCGRPDGPGRGPGRGVPAGRLGADPGRGAGRTVARSVRRTRRQDRPAGRAGRDAVRPLVAAELAPHRAALVQQAAPGYPQPPTVIVADGTRPAWRPGSFTRVLVDVPCTGLGALRRRPESRWRRQPGDVEQLHQLQLALLGAAIDSTAPGGVIGYVTCSPHRRETVDVVDRDAGRARRRRRWSRRPTCCRRCPTRPRRTSSSCGRTGTGPTRCSRRTCAARWLAGRRLCADSG